MGKEMINEVEFLIKMLEEEWSVSKETKEKVVIERIEAEMFVRAAGYVDDEVRKYINSKGDILTFDESLNLTKQMYIVFRIAKKLVKENLNSLANEFIEVKLDMDEKKMFYRYLGRRL
ncbi:MAG: hypothetical protein E7262_00625 [Lachnospiraceae bacterium]|nr:hypothetical protein [Lachnospiraceae bacterium]